MNCAEKIIRANNPLHFIHQVTIEIKSLIVLDPAKVRSNFSYVSQKYMKQYINHPGNTMPSQ